SNCSWTAASEDGWITVGSSRGADGSGTAAISVSPNSGPSARIGHLEIAGRGVEVDQAGNGGCSYQLSSLNLIAPAAGGTSTVDIKADALCGWSAVKNASWITITDGGPAYGTRTMHFTVDANSTNSDRSAVISIGDQVFTVSQPSSLPNASSGLRFAPVPPCRLVDTRKCHDDLGRPY